MAFTNVTSAVRAQMARVMHMAGYFKYGSGQLVCKSKRDRPEQILNSNVFISRRLEQNSELDFLSQKIFLTFLQLLNSVDKRE